jgi:glycosyltransferase involved in cell wall biosynthesis
MEKGTRVVFVFISVFSEEGGIQSYVQDLLQGYRSLNRVGQMDVVLLRDRLDSGKTFAEPEAQAHCRLRLHYCHSPWKLLARLKLMATLIWLCGQQPQRVFCGHVNLLPGIYWICRFFKCPYTVLTYGKEVWEPLKPRLRRPLQQANDIWTISRYSRDRATVANDLDPQKIKLLPCVVEGDRFTPGPPSPQLLQAYGLIGAKVLMTVARLWPGDRYKGVDVTIQALPEILSQEPTVKYLVVGQGADQPRLAQLAQDLGVGDRVVFVGFIPTPTLVDHYRLADVYVMPSQEGFGIVYLEAMACGVPVVAGNSDGSADPLQDGHLGWPVPYQDPHAVAGACLEALAGLDQRCDGAWLRQQVLALFDRSVMVKRLATIDP